MTNTLPTSFLCLCLHLRHTRPGDSLLAAVFGDVRGEHLLRSIHMHDDLL